MSLAPETWRQSIALNVQLLEQLESRRRALLQAQHIAQSAFDAAKETLDAVNGQLLDVVSQSSQLQDNNRQLRGRLASRVFQRLPVELLREIFLDLLLSFENAGIWRSGVRVLHAEVLSVPFTLAAVCSKWRTLALHTSRLWACIFVPSINKKLPRHAYDRVQTLVHRSKDAPLDIRLVWDDNIELALAPTSNTPESKILTLLGKHCSRWRRFDLFLPHRGSPRSAMDIFRAATPRLEEFSILAELVDDTAGTPARPNFLPSCPNLRSFRSDYANIIPSPQNASLPALSRLELCVDMPAITVWPLLRLAAPSLQYLDLQFFRAPDHLSQALSSRIAFPSLECLTVYSDFAPLYAANFEMLSFPSLTTLEISSLALAMLVPVWIHTPNKISSITIQSEEDQPPLATIDAQCLHIFTAARRLTVGTDCVVTAAFLSALADIRADGKWILPALDTLTFDGIATLDAVACESLVSLLRARHDAAREDSAGSPCTISDVTFNRADVPEWVKSQVHCI